MHASLRVILTTLNGKSEELAASLLRYSRRHDGDEIVVVVDPTSDEGSSSAAERRFKLAEVVALEAAPDY